MHTTFSTLFLPGFNCPEYKAQEAEADGFIWFKQLIQLAYIQAIDY